MRTIPLTQGKVALIDDEDYNSLSRYKWYASKIGYTYYATRKFQMPDPKLRQTIRMHRVILNAPGGVEVDHINTNGLDNRRSNLRLCTRAENNRHQRINRKNKSGFKGVSFSKSNASKPWIVFVKINGKCFYFGYYSSSKKAAQVYDAAALKYHGEFALTNKMLGLI